MKNTHKLYFERAKNLLWTGLTRRTKFWKNIYTIKYLDFYFEGYLNLIWGEISSPLTSETLIWKTLSWQQKKNKHFILKRMLNFHLKPKYSVFCITSIFAKAWNVLFWKGNINLFCSLIHWSLYINNNLYFYFEENVCV